MQIFTGSAPVSRKKTVGLGLAARSAGFFRDTGKLRGFSTLEILIAMTVLVLALSAVGMLFPGIQAGIVDGQMSSEGLAIAQRTLENQQELARKDFRMVAPTTTQQSVNGTTYQNKIGVESLDYFTKQITATTTWGQMYGRTQEIVLTTRVSNFSNVVGGDTCTSVTPKNENWATLQSRTKLLGQDLLGDSSGQYKITGMDTFRGRTYITVDGGTATTLGPNNPTTAANDSSSGTVAWSQTSNAKASDGAYATAVLANTQTSNYLKLTNLGFTVPTGATILGIKVEVLRRGSSSSNAVRDSVVKIVRADGTLGGTNKADTSTNWPTTGSTYATYGTASDLWSETGWSPAAVNDTDFGVVISAGSTGGSTSRTASIDHVRITITYTRQFYVLGSNNPSDSSNPLTFVGGLASNSVSTGLNAVVVATSTAFGSYAFVATNSTTGHLQTINLSAATPVVLATYQIPTATSVVANTIFFKDGYAYMGTANNTGGAEFYVIDVHNPSSIPTTPLGSYEVGAGVNRIFVKDNYAYLATDNSSRELIVLNLSNLAVPALYASYDAPGASGSGQGRSVYTVGDTLYFGRSYSLTNGAPEFAVLNAASATTIPGTPLGTYDMGTTGGTHGVYDAIGAYSALANAWYAFSITAGPATGGKFQILNVNNPGSISALGSYAFPNQGAGVALDCERNPADGKDYFFTASVPASGTFTNKGSISVLFGQ